MLTIYSVLTTSQTVLNAECVLFHTATQNTLDILAPLIFSTTCEVGMGIMSILYLC